MFNKTRKADDLRAISVPKFDFSTKYYPKIAVYTVGLNMNSLSVRSDFSRALSVNFRQKYLYTGGAEFLAVTE